MTDLRLLGHSAVEVRKDDSTLVIDPGVFSDLSALAAADGVLITHGHPDHVAAAALVDLAVPIWAPADVVATLTEAGIAADRLHVVAPGDALSIGGFQITVHGGEHAQVYPSIPRPANNAYLIDGALLHPGDALPQIDGAAEVALVLLPITAPWLKLSEAVDFARGYPAAVAIPIHDAILTGAGKQLLDGIVTALLGASTYRRPSEGEIVTL